VLGQFNVSLELNFRDYRLEDLSVSELPECHGEHHEGDPLDEVECQHRHFLVERRRFTVVVADEKSLVDVQDNEGETGDGVKRRHGATVAERDTNLKQDGGVAVMDQVLGASV
jgi:hypothetical protein